MFSRESVGQRVWILWHQTESITCHDEGSGVIQGTIILAGMIRRYNRDKVRYTGKSDKGLRL